MGQDATKHGDERLAALVLHVVLGATVDRHDDGTRPGMYDLDLTYPDGRLGAAEVVSTRDRQELGQLAATLKLGYVREPRLTKFWWVQVSKQASIKRTRDAITPLLVDLERQGHDRVPRNSFGDIRDQLDAMAVEACWSRLPTERHPPGFYLWPGPKGAFPGDPDRIAREATKFLRTVPDVAAKLDASGAAERHAVVIVTVDRFDLFSALEDGGVPTTPPDLPEGIDHLWLVTLKAPPLQAAFWMGGGPWVNASLTAEQMGVSVTDS